VCPLPGTGKEGPFGTKACEKVHRKGEKSRCAVLCGAVVLCVHSAAMDELEAKEAVHTVQVAYAALADLEGLVETVLRLWRARAWRVLGYRSWEALCHAEFGTPELPRTFRKRVVKSLHEAGMPLRYIAVVTGVGKSQVDRDLVPKRDSTPRRRPSRLTKVDMEDDQDDINELNAGLAAMAISVGMIQELVEELGAEEIRSSDLPIIDYMRMIADVVQTTFAPFLLPTQPERSRNGEVHDPRLHRLARQGED